MTVAYVSETGERLVVQGSSRRAAVVPTSSMDTMRLQRALRLGQCSVCDAPAPSASLDACGRCDDCQP